VKKLTNKKSHTLPGTTGAGEIGLFDEVRALIERARDHVAATANSTLTMLYWQIGQRVRRDILADQRAEYGQQIIATLSQQLEPLYGKGFTRTALSRMVKFADLFPDEEIVATLSQQLGWSHFVEILPLKNPLARKYYAEISRIERWSVRTLRGRIASQLFERTALSKKPESLVDGEIKALRETGQLTPDLVFRDPYMLDFLGLPDGYSEKDLESAILREMESFLLELGSGFTFVARQKRITVGDDDYYLDLLFFHRELRRLVAIELKLEKFQAAHKGQMELYLRWLDKYERKSHEETPMGLILCATANAEQVELLQLDQHSIRVAEYVTELPSPQALRDRLHRAIERARQQALPNPVVGDKVD
jgi:predicted nuclease of restriction endonuclease-like (RecB) superfamily